MFAIVETGGKQYKVSEGDIIFVEKLGIGNGKRSGFVEIDAKAVTEIYTIAAHAKI